MKKILFASMILFFLAYGACTDKPEPGQENNPVENTGDSEKKQEAVDKKETDKKETQTDEKTVSDAEQSTVPETVEEITNIGEITNTPDSKNLRCNGEVLTVWPLHNKKSSGVVKTTTSNGVMTAVIDASAGGSPNAPKNPFVYLSLETGKRVEITDHQSVNSTAWDLGLKRFIIRTNSGDSGPKGLRLGVVAKTTFDKVTAIPLDMKWAKDDTFDSSCNLQKDPINTPYTAFNVLNKTRTNSGSWYAYSQGVSPNAGDIYILQDPTSKVAYKIQIQSWKSGVITIRWAKLK